MSANTSCTSAIENVGYPWIKPKGDIVKQDTPFPHYPLRQGWSVLIDPIEVVLLDIDLKELTPYNRLTVQRTAGVTSQIETVLSLLVSKGTLIPVLATVRDYLTNYPDMIDLLIPVCKIAKERFGMRAQLSLEVYRDPEIDDEYLTIYVRQDEYDENIVEIIESMSDEYEHMFADRFGWLLVTTDFGPPR